MWIITNGIDGGIAKLIGDAVRQERIQQINSRIMTNPVLSSDASKRKQLKLIGIAPKDSVAYGVFFDGRVLYFGTTLYLILTLLLLNMTCPFLTNSVDPDQLVSSEANWSGSALFVIKLVNFYQKPWSSNLIGWKLEVGVASLFIQHDKG